MGLEKSKTLDEMKASKNDPKSKAEMLMARLVDRPENSQVLQMINTRSRKAPSSSDGGSPANFLKKKQNADQSNSAVHEQVLIEILLLKEIGIHIVYLKMSSCRIKHHCNKYVAKDKFFLKALKKTNVSFISCVLIKDKL